VIRILVVDDQDLLRSGTAMVLGAAEDMTVVGEAADGREAIARAEALRPDVVVMDVQMPGMDGIEATGELLRRRPETRVLVLTTFDVDAYAYGALVAGASGFLLKQCSAAELLAGIRAVAAGNAIAAPRVTRKLIELAGPALTAQGPTRAGPHDGLSDREREVLDHVAAGYSNAEIAVALWIAQATVKTHVTSVLRKLGLRDRVHAVIYAHRHGLCDGAPIVDPPAG